MKHVLACGRFAVGIVEKALGFFATTIKSNENPEEIIIK